MRDRRYRQIERAIHKMDRNLKPSDSAYQVAMILLVGLYVGPNIRKVTRFTDLPWRFVAEVGRRLRANGVWQGRKIVADWFDKKAGGCAFWLDVNVGLGYMQRTAA